MGGSKQTQTTTAKQDPWAPAQPVLNDVLANTQKLGGDTANFTPTYSDASKAAAQGMVNMGQGPMASQGAWQNLADGTRRGYDTGADTLMQSASGGMLGNTNPWLDKVLATSRGNAADAVNAQFAGAGRYGSGAHTGVLADRLGGIETQARMGNYDKERQAQLNAAGILHNAGLQSGQYAGQVDAAKLQQLGLLGQGGAMQDQMANAARLAPLQANEWMAKMATPIAGLGSTSNQTQTTATPANTGGMIAGAAMAGLGAATGNPMMMMNGISGGLGAAGGGGMPSMGGGQSGAPFFGAFGSPAKQVYAGNDLWSTTASTAPTGMFGNSFFGGLG